MADALEQAMEEEMDAVDGEALGFDPLKVYVRSFVDNQRSIDTFEQRDTEYQALATLLQDLLQQTRRDLMVPLGPCAFVPGYLRHTNEVLVLLGDNWFALRSVVQALAIIQRRRKHIRDVIRILEEAQEALRIKVQLTSQMQAEQDPAVTQLGALPRSPGPAASRRAPTQRTPGAGCPANVPQADQHVGASDCRPDPFSYQSVSAARQTIGTWLVMEDAAAEGEAPAKVDEAEDEEEEPTAPSGQLEEDELQAILAKLNCLREVSASEAAPHPTAPDTGKPVVTNPAEIFDFLQRLTEGRAGPPHASSCADSGPAAPEGAAEGSPPLRKTVHWGPETATPPPPPAPPDPVVVPMPLTGSDVVFTGRVQERAAAPEPPPSRESSSPAAAPTAPAVRVSRFKQERMQRTQDGR
eukprot:GGOE01014667.1.p1 GENE.GGOE01014667.1~~GGOE01014667.1.p1  ORF type:complete len:423 (-),score=102.88 GGOE01014667.1:215-1447(-)